MKWLVFAFFLLNNASLMIAQDTLVTWDDEEILGKVVKIENKIIYVILVDEPHKTYRIHSGEFQRLTYENGQTIYFFEKYPDIVTKMKKASPYKNMIEAGPFGIPFNHFYVGYERLFEKRNTMEVQAGIIAPMLMTGKEKLRGGHVNFAWKRIFSEPVKISGLSVRPKMQGAYAGLMLTLNAVSYSQSIDYPVDTVGFNILYDPVKTRVPVFIPTLHFVFGYNKLIAPAVMMGFCGGIGGGPRMIMSSDEHIRDQASLPETAIGIQRFASGPFSLIAQISIGVLFK
ncbi:MAG: hypothetical protein AB7V36_01245 [Bacteroidales bacterium]|nr:hypothetical protein [Bacteroidales bacterium]HPF00609.1 hypothetical protein [Bacteroidales bacterium]